MVCDHKRWAMWQTEQLIVCCRSDGFGEGAGGSGSERAGGRAGGWRVGGGEERVSDERSTSLTVVLHSGKHQSRVIYSLPPWPGPSHFFSLANYVCKHQTRKQDTGQITCICIASLSPPLSVVCLHPFRLAMQMHGCHLYQPLSPTLPFLSPIPDSHSLSPLVSLPVPAF